LLDWLLDQAEQNLPEALRGASVPVAWMGRTSTDDKQDPTLPLPRQLDLTRGALPDGFVIVAKFYDVESGRTALRHRGRGHAHELLDIPIARDGSITDLLSEARQSDRRFVAVVWESIDRVARGTYLDLLQAVQRRAKSDSPSRDADSRRRATLPAAALAL
jgi:hypothetical protein